MHRFFVRENFAPQMTITGKDAYHITKVLRMQVGEQVQIVSLDQVSALMKIASVTGDEVSIVLEELLPGVNEPRTKLLLAQGLPKGDKFDFVTQKAVELGVSTIIPVALDNCVVQLKGDKAEKKVSRWQKIAEEAAKQAKRDIIPTVAPVSTLAELVMATEHIQLKILAYEVEDKLGLRQVLSDNAEAESVAILIGPEGGISKDEYTYLRAHGWQSVSLGRRILRTETACIATLAAVLYASGDFGG